MNLRKLLASSTLMMSFLVSGPQAAAAMVGYSFSGTLASGGGIAGTFHYETGMPEYGNDGNDSAGAFLLSDWSFSVSGSPVLINASYSMASSSPGGNQRLLQTRAAGPPPVDISGIAVQRNVELSLNYFGSFTDPDISAALGISPQPYGGPVYGYVAAENYLGGNSYDSITSLSTSQYVPTAVPVPAALWLLASGLAGMVPMFRCRARQSSEI